jgi:basic membrane protein A and related proteins
VDADQSFLGPHILTSAEKKVDRAVYLAIESVTKGTWRGGRNETFGLERAGVGLGKISPKVPKQDIQAVEAIERQIVDGAIPDIPTEVP